MAEKTIIPYGPQHPVLPEPLHLDLVMEDETVVEAVPSIGFIHRGLERLAETQDFTQMGYVAERICGICSCIHGQGYSQGIETLLGMDVPERAQFLRLVWGEESRIQSHLLWLGLAADAKNAITVGIHPTGFIKQTGSFFRVVAVEAGGTFIIRPSGGRDDAGGR